MGVGHIVGCSTFDPIPQTRDFHVRKRAKTPGEQNSQVRKQEEDVSRDQRIME